MPDAPIISIDDVVNALTRWRYRYTDEQQLQAGLAGVLEQAGLAPRREVILADGLGRIDLLCGRIGIEVKVDGQNTAVQRQLRRYASSDQLDGLVLVTTRVRHRPPIEIAGKPVRLVCLAAAGAFQ